MRKAAKALIIAACAAALSIGAARAQFVMPGDRAHVSNFVFASTNWIVYGQTNLTSGTPVGNPTPNTAGTYGEIASLPYTVPAGNCLMITAYGIEAYVSTTGVANMFVWLGATLSSNAVVLHSVNSDNFTNETLGFQPEIPGGTIVNVQILNTQGGSAAVYGWYVKGRLVHGPCR